MTTRARRHTHLWWLALLLLLLLALAPAATQADVFVWKPKQGGVWGQANNWASRNGGFPNAFDAEAELLGNLNVNQAVINIGANYTLRRLTLENMTSTQSYLLQASNAQGALTFDGGQIALTDNNRAPHTIAVPIRIADNNSLVLRNDSVGIDANSLPPALTISGTISGDKVGGLFIRPMMDSAPAEVLLTGNNTFKARVRVAPGGYLAIDKDAALGDAANGVELVSGILRGRNGTTVGKARTIELLVRGTLAGDENSAAKVFQVDAKVTGKPGPLILDGVRLTNPANDFASTAKAIFVGNGNLPGSLHLARPDVLGAAEKIVMTDGQLVAEESFALAPSLQFDLSGRVRVIAAKTLTATGATGGPGRLIKQGPGTLVLTNEANAHRGNTLNGGVLAFSKDTQLGATGRNVLIRNAAVLRADAPVTTARRLVIDGSGTLRANFAADPKKPFELAGVITGGELIKDGPGAVKLTGLNTHDATTVREGSLLIASNTALGKGDGLLTLVGNSVLRVSGTFFSNRPIEVRNSRPTDSAGIYVEKGSKMAVTSGIQAIQSQFTKSGEGSLLFDSGSNTSIGTRATIEGGELGIAKDAVFATGSGLFNSSAGKLKGQGKLVGWFNNSGRVNGGGDPGTLTVDGLVQMQAGSIFELDINSAIGTAGQSQGWGLMDITGALELHGPLSLELHSYALDGQAGAIAPGLFDTGSPYRWEFARAAGGISGFATGLVQVDATAFRNPLPSGAHFSVEQTGSSLYVVYDPLAAVPEPATGPMMGLGLLALSLLAAQRRPSRPAQTPASR